MNIKKPSVKDMKNVNYLGRFQRDEFIQQGHNSGPKSPLSVLTRGEDQIGGGGGGGSPRPRLPSGSRNIEIPKMNDRQAAQDKYVRAEADFQVKSSKYKSKSVNKRTKEERDEVEGSLKKSMDALKEAEGDRFDAITGQLKSYYKRK